ncbi:MAG: DNA repair protein RadA [Acidimicrobiia bacterium]|nr:MAG: DNA repair protein RadA [Acidimicrobiia bacterium]
MEAATDQELPRVHRLDQVDPAAVPRIASGSTELDRVLGGGLVPGSVVLLGGEPGVGKSTLVLQMSSKMRDAGGPALVATAEESVEQVALRGERLGVSAGDVMVVAEDDVDRILAAAHQVGARLLVVDSIQTVGVGDLDSAPGSVVQVRESASRLIRFAKTTDTPVVLVGHVTKDGGLAGPKLLEHMVDVVLYLEGDPDRGFRALRSFKNRFGPTHRVALFDMRAEGLVELEDPSRAFLADWRDDVPGTVAFCAIDGRRPVMVEIQALVAPTSHQPARRSVRGVDASRVHQILAVLDRHCGVGLADSEVYVNVVGGWRLDEPACDLPVALAVVSSALYRPLSSLAAWGEVGLAGEVRPVSLAATRQEEARRLGVSQVVAPAEGVRLTLAEALAMAGLATPTVRAAT